MAIVQENEPGVPAQLTNARRKPGPYGPFNTHLLSHAQVTEQRAYLGGVLESGGGVELGGVVLSGGGGAVPEGEELSAGGVAVVPGAVD
jgi:hypothetical protein